MRADAAASGGVDEAFDALELRIEAMWAGRRPAGTKPMERLKDWARALVRRAALIEPGRSARQIARRVKSWAGVSRRDLQGLAHTEQLYARLHAALESGEIDWAGLAAAAGFADQAHMIRQMRRHTGFTPERLRQNAANEEAFWCYRLLRQYFTNPERQ